MSHLHTNLLRVLKKQANAVVTIFALDLLLILHFLHHICPKQISCNCILPFSVFFLLRSENLVIIGKFSCY